MRLKDITVCGFRGFKDKQTMNLDRNLVLVRGRNGSGKSSLVEAIEWLFFDEISRKKKSACKSEYSGDFLRNLHCEKNEETYVELLAEIHGKETKLKKKLVSPEKKEYYIDGKEVDDFSSLGISFADVFKPVLSQIEVKHYVETDPKDRWEETSKILGLGILSELRTDLQELVSSKKAESLYVSTKKVYDGIESDLKGFAELDKLHSILEKRPFGPLVFEDLLVKAITGTYSLATKSVDELGNTVDEELKKLAQKSEDFEIMSRLMVPGTSVVKDLLRLTEEVKELFSMVKQFRSFDAELYRFLEIGKNLIHEPTCPFCLEETLTAEKRHQIDIRIKENEQAGTLLSSINSTIGKGRQSIEEYCAKILLSVNIIALEKIRERIQCNAEYSNEVNRIDSLEKQIDELNEAGSAVKAMLTALVDYAKSISEGRTKFDERKTEHNLAEVEVSVSTIETVLTGLRDDTQLLCASLISKAPSLSAEEKAELNKAMLFRKMLGHLQDIKYVGIYESNLDTVSALIGKIEEFEKEKSKQLLTDLNEKIRNFYMKLNPREKTQFSEIAPTKGKSRRMQLKAISYGKNMNPVSCFSESHMNCLCLSIYFSQRVLNNPYWDFVILDDPVQSMDEDHAKNLIRIIDEVHMKKQVIVLSHNARFCQDFTDLFYGQDYLFYEFSGDSKEGPRIDLKQAPFQTYIANAKEYCGGNTEERATSGNNLRKAIERFTADVLIHIGKRGHAKVYELSLDERLDKIETAKLMTLKEIGEIKSVLNVCDASCHEPPRREVTSRELTDGIEVIDSLFSKYLCAQT
ncbi:MAG: AAA family ATPase [Candidatus Bathyarchaeia archaeon]